MLAFLQFTIILDFMIISPLGAILLRDLHLPTQKFGLVVSVYAFSASLSGLLAAGFADRFDRKKLLLFFYTGFTGGTLFCGLAPTYQLLLAARIVTGVFGGVIGSISMAIITDLFPLNMRGRVMGVVQTSFAASQVLGLPLGLYLANRWGWHAPFLMIVALTRRRRRPHLRAPPADRRPPQAAAGGQPLRPPLPHRLAAPLSPDVRDDDAAGDGRLHADAVRQHVHHQQPRHLLRAAADDLPRDGALHAGERPLHRAPERQAGQVSPLLRRHGADDHHGPRLHPPRSTPRCPGSSSSTCCSSSASPRA